jgi:hypothetical protein
LREKTALPDLTTVMGLHQEKDRCATGATLRTVAPVAPW